MNYIKHKAAFILTAAFFMSACSQTQTQTKNTMTENKTTSLGNDTATFGAGCFWCVEAVFQQLKGVEKVISGYMGGDTKNPSYHDVCSGETGHVEVCQIIFNPKEISYKDLLEAFWQTHDPTTINRQGNDIGSQYRSVIFYYNEQQKELAQKYKKELDLSGAFEKPIITAIEPAKVFYKAEDYHQNYYNQNSEQGYCTFMIKPKIEKFRKAFHNKLKEE